MCELKDLPNGLLSQIAGNSTTGTLHALSLTSGALSRVSYPLLYNTICLPTPLAQPKDWENRILLLARTLASRRELAERITNLDVSVSFIDHDTPFDFYTLVNLLNTVQLGAQRDNEAWMRRLCHGCSQPWLGLILYMLPNLKTLCARFFKDTSSVYISSGGPSSANHFDRVDLFSDRNMDTSLVSGLCKLEKLELQCTSLDMQSGRLPTQRRMWTGSDYTLTMYPEFDPSNKSPQVTEIYMTHLTTLFLPYDMSIPFHKAVFGPRAFAALRRIDIDLDNMWRHCTQEPVDIMSEKNSGI